MEHPRATEIPRGLWVLVVSMGLAFRGGEFCWAFSGMLGSVVVFRWKKKKKKKFVGKRGSVERKNMFHCFVFSCLF